ncbi:unnamed protein product, partial [Mycena citricolor]
MRRLGRRHATRSARTVDGGEATPRNVHSTRPRVADVIATRKLHLPPAAHIRELEFNVSVNTRRLYDSHEQCTALLSRASPNDRIHSE